MFNKSVLVLSFILASVCFGAGYVLSYREDVNRYGEMGRLAQDHLAYALQLKDDMSMIDWSKSLEKFESVRAFRASSGSKIFAEGGNRDHLAQVIPDNVAYHFPVLWSYHDTLKNGSLPSVDLVIVFQTRTGPLFWGFCFWAASFITGLIVSAWISGTTIAPKPETDIKEEVNPKQPARGLEPVYSKLTAAGSHAIFVDKHYVVQEATPMAGNALGRDASKLVGSHLLDLLPKPDLMRAIETAQEGKIEKAFPSHPRVSVRLRPAEDGTILILEAEG